MQIMKFLLLFLIVGGCTAIGILLSKKYVNHVRDLKQIKTGLTMFQTKVKLTYEPIPKIFSDISVSLQDNQGVSNLFLKASQNMREQEAGQAWNKALEEIKEEVTMTKEDTEVLKGLSKLLGKVDVEGQISEIELVDTFLDTQIKKAEEEKSKNEKMYKTLGITAGAAISILLI